MVVDKVKDIIKYLSESQDSYGQLYKMLDTNNNWEEFTKTLNIAGCKNILDVVMFFES